MNNNLVPAYLFPYVLTGSVVMVTTVILALRTLTGAPRRARWTVSGLLAAWFFAALATSWLGFYQGSPSRAPTIQYGLLIPILIGILLFWRWPALQRMVETVPQRWLVTVQAYRVLGVIFLILYAAGRMPGAFALPAGIGDVLAGLLAPVAGLAYARGWRGSAGLLRAWNLFGLADLMVAIATGFLSSPSPLQILALNDPNRLISAFPLVMVPVFLVPLSVLLHLASLQKLGHTYGNSRP